MLFLVLPIIVVVLIVILFSSLYVVRQQSVAIIERFGRYQKLSNSGIHLRLPFGIEDALRSSVPKLTLDELFEKKDEIALEVQKQVAEEMSTYGYIIVKTLITKVEPDAEVKQSMNEINAAQRKRVAAQELAEADKIKIVTAAEAEAEKDRLHGVGIAEQRKAIVDGLADSIKELKGANVELKEEQIMSILLTNQYLDTLNNFADNKGNNTIFLPANPDGVESIRTQILSALKAK